MQCIKVEELLSCRRVGRSTTVVDQDVKKGIPGILHSRPAKLRMLSAKGGVYDTGTGRPLSDASWKRGQKFDVRPANN